MTRISSPTSRCVIREDTIASDLTSALIGMNTFSYARDIRSTKR